QNQDRKRRRQRQAARLAGNRQGVDQLRAGGLHAGDRDQSDRQRQDSKGRGRRLSAVAVGAITADHFQIERLIFSKNPERNPFPRPLLPDFLVELPARTDFFFVDGENDVALL